MQNLNSNISRYEGVRHTITSLGKILKISKLYVQNIWQVVRYDVNSFPLLQNVTQIFFLHSDTYGRKMSIQFSIKRIIATNNNNNCNNDNIHL